MMFGSSSPFGASTPSLFGGASSSSSPFGTSTSASPFGMSTTTNPFGAKPFGSSTFGGQTGSSLFGSGTATGVFGATQATTFGSSAPAFGASSASPFGGTQSGFGSGGTSVFGQKPASPFGSFGSNQNQSNPFGTPSFGQTQSAFGSQPTFGASAPAFGAGSMPSFGSSTSAFGAQSAPAFGNPFGGSSSAFGSTPVFGQSSSTFGSSSAPAFGSSSAFGTGTAFGSQPASPFGASSSPSFGSGLSSFSGGNRAGTRAFPYNPKTDVDGGTTFKLMSISAMDAYKDKSPEELRWEDYQAGDKGGPTGSSGGLFGQTPSSSSFSSGLLQGTTPPFPSSSSSPFAPKPASAFPSTTFGTGSTSTSVFGTVPPFGSGTAPTMGSTTPAFGSTPAFGNATPGFGSTTPAFGTSSPAFGSTPAFGSNPAFGSTTPSFGTSSAGLFGTSQAFNPAPASSAPFGMSNFMGSTQSISGVFPSPSQPPMFGQSSTPIFGSTSATGIFNPSQARPAGTTPSFGTPSMPGQITPSFSFSNPAQSQGIFGTSPASNVQTPFGSQSTVPVVSAPFGTLPAMPQMSIGRTSGSNPSVQYGISSIPVSEKPAQVRSSSLLTPRHVTPRSKIRMHTRRYNSKKDSPKISFFSDGEEAPVTPKADVSFVPRENPRALFIHQADQSPVTPIAAKRGADAVTSAHIDDMYDEARNFAAGDDDFLSKEPASPVNDWSGPDNSDAGLQGNAPRTAEKVTSKPFSKLNGLREEHTHRGNGYISMTGHRAGEAAIAYEHGADIEALMPKLRHSDYYTEPRVQELAAKERGEPGYCRRVPEFVVGRKGYGHIKFLGETDVRRLDLEGIIQFNRCEVLVYMDESKKPPLGQGLNKPASVTLLNVKCVDKKTGQCFTDGPEVERFEKKLKRKTEEQGAEFVSYDAVKGEWTFRVKHFSRYGLDESDDDEEAQISNFGKLITVGMDMMEGVEDVTIYNEGDPDVLGNSVDASSGGEYLEDEEPIEELQSRTLRAALPHTLPAQLRLNPLKMQQLKTSFFPLGEDESEEMVFGTNSYQQPPRVPVSALGYKSALVEDTRSAWPKRSPWKGRPSKQMRLSPHALWQRAPVHSPLQNAEQAFGQVLLDHRKSTFGFRLEEPQNEQLICASNSSHFVDAALFLGTSFRAGWGPHGFLVHSGSPVGHVKASKVLSSCINFEKVALDRTARDEQGKMKDGLLNFQFVSPLSLHMSFSKPVSDKENSLTLRSLVCNRVQLQKICDDYEDLIVKQHSVVGISNADQLVLRHQVMVWQLISVLYSEKVLDVDDEEAPESMAEMKARIAKIDPETELLARRAEFSSWLQDSVFHLVQADLDCLKERSHLKDILLLLTGKQVELAVEKAILEGDVRLACLLSQVAGSVVNRQDIAAQLEVWASEDLDETLIENDRLSLFKLLGGDLQGSLCDRKIDWKRFLGMVMWYGLPPEVELPFIVNEFHQLVDQGDAPRPTPMYLEEASAGGGAVPRGAYDSAYYLMLLHASGSAEEVDIEKMFSSASSTFDSLDYRTAWHQRSVLQAIGALGPRNLHLLDTSFVAQLLAVGLVHWAVYVVLHMPAGLDCPHLHEKVIKDILGQYCEVWGTSELQQSFLEKELSIPSEWLHEALAVYWQYCNDPVKSLQHLLKSFSWQDAHVLFMTKVSASLFLNSEHAEIWNLASQMEAHKMEIENWDLGAGIYIDFFTLKGSFQNEAYDAELESPVEGKMCACRDFFERLRESQRFWEPEASKLLRLAFTKMADEIATLLLSESKLKSLPSSADTEVYGAAMEAPVPEDVQLCRLQGAVSTFATWVNEGVTVV